MPVSSLLEEIGVELDALYAQFVPLQEAYQPAHDQYFQGILTPQVIPEDGNTVAPDLSLHPSDQVADWTSFGASLPDMMDFSIEITKYTGLEGEGWVSVATVIEDQSMWKKGKGFGPEARDFDWINVGDVDNG
jgi:hypothetical protein